MKDFKRHLFNIKNQNREFETCKENLAGNEAAILVDFSENYFGKLAKEIQSYFGSSRNQATLHTGIIYVDKKVISFATVSDSPDHSPAAIWAHSDPSSSLKWTPSTSSLMDPALSIVRKKLFLVFYSTV
ncbi:hypothetical protein JTE90_023433 [Oedothorax gibbosus]|uniref:Uncharacterized protein n=1 Tax=Oedothorax gibbosus TaxID=931172 RepID=A0AAV6U153_9ARAC|nr:hypothetical protein JTE90_023433 [Oedothorax gibbosus]